MNGRVQVQLQQATLAEATPNTWQYLWPKWDLRRGQGPSLYGTPPGIISACHKSILQLDQARPGHELYAHAAVVHKT